MRTTTVLRALALAMLAFPLGAQEIWARRNNPLLMPSDGHAMVTDTVRGRVVLYGVFFTFHAEWDGQRWSFFPLAVSPGRRSDHAMAFDPVRAVTVLFGGVAQGGVLSDDTWEWNGTIWQQRFPTTSPSARGGHAMAYDSVGEKVLLFGGNDGQVRGDTWEWDGLDWRLQQPSASPSARTEHAMAGDSLRDRIVLFGGTDGTNPSADTWEWDGSTWQQVALTGDHPPARAGHGMAFDPSRGACLLYGGSDGDDMGDTWRWDGNAWSEQFPAVVPRPRSGHAMAYDPVNKRVMMMHENFSSPDLGPMADMWEFFEPQVPAQEQVFGTGCSGAAGIPELSLWLGYLPWLGESFNLYLDQLPENPSGPGSAFSLVGFSDSFDGRLGLNLPYDLGNIGMPGCLMLASTDQTRSRLYIGTRAFWDLRVPDTTSLVGQRFYLQGFVLAPGANPLGVLVSNGLAIDVGMR